LPFPYRKPFVCSSRTGDGERRLSGDAWLTLDRVAGLGLQD